ncbi:MAG: hypothetical protein ABIO44_00320, partial [Saprospiraceae bacterium]
MKVTNLIFPFLIILLPLLSFAQFEKPDMPYIGSFKPSGTSKAYSYSKINFSIKQVNVDKFNNNILNDAAN